LQKFYKNTSIAMSGILGVYQSQAATPWQTMLQDLTSIGQDGKGDWHDPQVGLSLGRSQLFNTPESCLEPPVIEAEGCVLVWDGRLDDRQSLLAGRNLVTDAQLIIESYRRWGEDCLNHLVGEYVFILWDTVQHKLLVGCDRVGGRTIAYAWDGRTLLLSSRVLTLLLHPQISPELDDLYLAHTVCDFWSQPPTLTPFTQIKRLLPGHALILSDGHFQHRSIAILNTRPTSSPPQSPAAYYEQFWDLLNQAVKDRLRSHRPICTTLSGGLDSTTVTVSILNHLSSVDAFSTVTDLYPEFDERAPIQSFLNTYPEIKWHSLNSDDAWALSEPWERLPITDDPLITCTLPMNLRLMEAMQQQGFGCVFDGEWGDELFRVSLLDLAKAGNWNLVGRSIFSESRWHSSVWHNLVLPYMPTAVQRLWFARCQRLSDPIPAWIKPSYRATEAVQLAQYQMQQGALRTTQEDGIRLPIEAAGMVGSMQVYRHLHAFHQLEHASPMQDHRLLEFALAIPPALQDDADHDKIFLRQANATTLPKDVLWRPKDNYFDPMKYAGIGKGLPAIEFLQQARQNPYLNSLIDFDRVTQTLNQYRQEYGSDYVPGKPFQNGTANRLYILLTFCNWYEKVVKRYAAHDKKMMPSI
jgi:asparagine synthase (glutamine-hydrolysing)